MLLDSINVIKPYPTEEIEISFNEVLPLITLARLGVRYKYFYFDTFDNKFNFRQTPAYALGGGIVDNVRTVSATFPSNYVNPSEFSPLIWDVASDREYLCMDLRGGASAVTIWPSHPYPKITKNSNTSINIDIGIIAAAGFDGKVTTPEFRKKVTAANLDTVNFDDSLVTTSNRTAYISKSRKNISIGGSTTISRTLDHASKLDNMFPNSLQVDIPVILTPTLDPTQGGVVHILSFFNDTSTNNNFNGIVTSLTNLRCLSSETLQLAGINEPYTSIARMYEHTGHISVVFNDQLWIKPYGDVKMSWETFNPLAAGGVTFTPTADPNNCTVSVNNAVYPGYPIYLFNYRFQSTARDLLTVSFLPSSFVMEEALTYADVKTVMVDNYYQTSYEMPESNTLLLKRFIETVGDNTLSCFDPTYPLVVYKNEQWFPANRKMRFINNGQGNRHFVRIQLQSILGAVYESRDETNFLLNKDKILFNISLKNVTDSSATTDVTIFPTPDDKFKIRWSANPPNNVVFKDIFGNVIVPDTLVPAQFYATVHNLGVDKTEISLYSEEFDLTASTFWFPSSSVFEDVTLQLRGSVGDKSPLNVGTISATCIRNGLSYPPPRNASLIWNETANDPNGTLVIYNKDYTGIIRESTIYGSSVNNTIIHPIFGTIPVETNPRRVSFDLSCNLFRPDFSLNSSRSFTLRQYPSIPYLSIDATTTGGIVYNSNINTHVILTTPQTISLAALYPDLQVGDLTKLKWAANKYNPSNPVGTSTEGTGSSFSLNFDTVSACVTLSALDGIPSGGSFGEYNFSSKICFYKLGSVQPFWYKAFPSFRYDATPLPLTYANHTESKGLSSFRSCHTEFVQMSAKGGFDEYVWKIGTATAKTKSNTTVLPVTFANVSATSAVSVSAFNHIFRSDDPGTIYNTAVSDNSTVFRQHMRFVPFPKPVINISLNRFVFNTDKHSEMPSLSCVINSGNTSLRNYDLSMVLSGAEGVQFVPISDYRKSFQRMVNVGIENTDFIIRENSYNNMVIFLSGTAGITIENMDFCVEQQAVSSNMVYLSAYNGPQVEIYAPKNIGVVGENIVFENKSILTFGNSASTVFSSFSFNSGEPGSGDIHPVNTNNIIVQYTTEGSKTPSLTGHIIGGSSQIRSWPDMISIKNIYEVYDPAISREFHKPVEMPHPLEDILVKPNEWQYASTINHSIESLHTNLGYLSAMCSIHNINFPKAYGGFLGTRYGNFKWHTYHTTDNLQTDIFSTLKSAQIIGNKMLTINNNRIEIFNISSTPIRENAITRIGNGEHLQQPIKLHYDEGKKRLYILENARQLMFVCTFDIDAPEDIDLTHYWGGFGARTDRTKLNDPTDFCLDTARNLFIVDRDAGLIKVYNKNLNWIRNIDLAGEKAVTIRSDGATLIVTTVSSKALVMDMFGNVRTLISHDGITSAIPSAIHKGILYIAAGNTLSKYTIDGSLIATRTFRTRVEDVIFDQVHCYVVFGTHLWRFVDFIEVDRIINNNEALSGFSWDAIRVHEEEFVTDYVFNDSLKKIHDNISLLNSRLDSKLNVDLNAYDQIIKQYTAAYTPPAISANLVYIAANEPVLYETINRGLIFLQGNLLQLQAHIDVAFNHPVDATNIQWTWRYHYVDHIQRPSIDRNPLTWFELQSRIIPGNPALSAVTSWATIRTASDYDPCGICWDESIDRACCQIPDIVFPDTISTC